MKRILLYLMQMLGLFLSYPAAGIFIYQCFKIDLPLNKDIANSKYLAIGTFFVLPVLGIINVLNRANRLFRVLGYVYLGVWLLAVLCTVNQILHK